MYNEVFNKNKVRDTYSSIMSWAKSLPYNVVVKKKLQAENLFKKIGITFSVYNNFDNAERLIPFDMFPRIITRLEWLNIKDGVVQRALAINAFLRDIYSKCEIIKAKKNVLINSRLFTRMSQTVMETNLNIIFGSLK